MTPSITQLSLVDIAQCRKMHHCFLCAVCVCGLITQKLCLITRRASVLSEKRRLPNRKTLTRSLKKPQLNKACLINSVQADAGDLTRVGQLKRTTWFFYYISRQPELTDGVGDESGAFKKKVSAKWLYINKDSR